MGGFGRWRGAVRCGLGKEDPNPGKEDDPRLDGESPADGDGEREKRSGWLKQDRQEEAEGREADRPRSKPRSIGRVWAGPCWAREKATTSLVAVGKGANTPVRLGPSPAAAPVTVQTRAAVAAARAGRSHQGHSSCAGELDAGEPD
jgi:hypothetical protein